MRREKLSVDLVDFAEVLDIGHKHIDLDNAFPGCAGGFNDGFDVGQDLAGLNLDVFVAGDEFAICSKWNLAREVDKSVGFDGLAVGADWGVAVGGEDLDS